jgi:hypothetical protein
LGWVKNSAGGLITGEEWRWEMDRRASARSTLSSNLLLFSTRNRGAFREHK